MKLKNTHNYDEQRIKDLLKKLHNPDDFLDIENTCELITLLLEKIDQLTEELKKIWNVPGPICFNEELYDLIMNDEENEQY